MSFADPRVVLAFGPVTSIEDTRKNRRYVLFFNFLIHFGAATRLFYYTLGCNSIFRYDALNRAGMYKILDAGDDLEVATRMRKEGKVAFNPCLKVGFDFRRYDQFGFWRTIFEWDWIVLSGGISRHFTYTKREYKNQNSDGKTDTAPLSKK